MGDYGKLYGGANEGTIRCMREMLSVAHLCFPNYTEACLLTGAEYSEKGISKSEAYELVNQLREIGSLSVLITSCIVDGQHAVVGFNHETDEYLSCHTMRFLYNFPVQVTFSPASLREGSPMATTYSMPPVSPWIPCATG